MAIEEALALAFLALVVGLWWGARVGGAQANRDAYRRENHT